MGWDSSPDYSLQRPLPKGTAPPSGTAFEIDTTPCLIADWISSALAEMPSSSIIKEDRNDTLAEANDDVEDHSERRAKNGLVHRQ